MDPRISFSSDFAEPHQAIQCHGNYREPPVSSDFEFRISNYGMIPADEIFSKGILLPLKDNGSNQGRKMTLREELLVDDDDDFEPSLPRLNSSGWWKDRLGLKRTQVVPKRNDAILGRVVEEKMPPMAQQDLFCKKP